MLRRPSGVPRMIWMHRECPFCASTHLNRSEGTPSTACCMSLPFGAFFALFAGGAITGLRERELLFND